MIINGKELIEIIPLADLYTTYKNHERLQVFYNKGRGCVTCSRIGTFIIVSREYRGKFVGREHVDLYTDDFILMTVDHIIPLSISKDDTLDNKQPMCEPCNHSKGSKLISNEQLSLNRKNARPMLAGIEIIRQLVPNIHRLNNDYMVMAGEIGVEPIISESKSEALPVGYSPL